MGYFTCDECGTVIEVGHEDEVEKHDVSSPYFKSLPFVMYTYPCPVCASDIVLNEKTRMKPEAIRQALAEL